MKKVLIATDGSIESFKAIDRAAQVAKSEDVEIIILNVAEDFCPLELADNDCETIRQLILKESKSIIAKAEDKLKQLGVAARGIVEFGSPAEKIVEIATNEGVDEIIVASHGKHGAKKLLMGSVTSRVIEWAKCPVTVIK